MGFFNNIGLKEIIFIGVVILIFFGGKKLTELARGAGETGKELKRIKKELKEPKP
ncbi:MAG: twin-arginine translocase TatA/TatE family subunit [Candidatus Blackburnbacteria bacterium]|nr:twin-arginine translocase TatA/TatE family subunit [Candidatus Blackburnbacteria bacterium]